MATENHTAPAPAERFVQAPAGVTLGPRSYAIEYAEGEGMAGYAEGDVLFVDPDQVPGRGDTVMIWFKGAPSATVKRLTLALPPADIDGGDVEPMLVCEQDAPPRRLTASMAKVDRVHKVVGKAEGSNG